MAAPKSGMVTATLDQKQMDKAIARIAKYEARPLARRAQQAYIEGARLMVRPIRAAAPLGPTGNLRRSVAARSNRLRAGEMSAATVGTRFRIAPHRHLVTGGTKPHSLAGKRKGPWSVFPDGQVRANASLMHPGSKANPFQDRVVASLAPQVQSFINARVLDLGESFGARTG